MSLKKEHIDFIEKYKKNQKLEKKELFIKFFITLTLLTSIVFLIYYKWNDELKFLGRKTTLVNAKIIKERRYHIGEGIYTQIGRCKFKFNQKEYITDFKTKNWKTITSPKEFKVGDYIKLKVLVENPLILKFIE